MMKKVMMFAGKGGVGKTTCSAATALKSALSGKKTLIISTDPTPSLGHIFGTGRCLTLTKIVNSLFVHEIGIKEVEQMWDTKFGKEVYEVFASIVDIKYNDFAEFMSSILPGIRDEFMVDYIREISERRDFDVIVWDTAPLGQTLGLLSMPSMLRKHMKMAPRIYSKLRLTNVSKKTIQEILKVWEDLSIKDITFLRDCVNFTIVTIPEALAVEQMDDIFNVLKKYELMVQNIIINNVVIDTSSSFMNSRAQQQRKYIEWIHSKYSSVQIVELPMFPLEIRGISSLQELGQKLLTYQLF